MFRAYLIARVKFPQTPGMLPQVVCVTIMTDPNPTTDYSCEWHLKILEVGGSSYEECYHKIRLALAEPPYALWRPFYKG